MLITGAIGLSYSSAPDKNDNLQEHTKESIIYDLSSGNLSSLLNDNEEESCYKLISDENIATTDIYDKTEIGETADQEQVNFLGFSVSRRALGIVCALCNGLNTGSMLVPMHYADVEGLDYAVSQGIGCFIALVLAWLIRYLYYVFRTQSFSEGSQALPSFHVKLLLLPGSMCGILWQLSNISNMLAVSSFGQAIGVGLVQLALVVSGFWGIFYYKEVKNKSKKILWFFFALILISAVCVLVSQQEESDDDDDDDNK